MYINEDDNIKIEPTEVTFGTYTIPTEKLSLSKFRYRALWIHPVWNFKVSFKNMLIIFWGSDIFMGKSFWSHVPIIKTLLFIHLVEFIFILNVVGR